MGAYRVLEDLARELAALAAPDEVITAHHTYAALDRIHEQVDPYHWIDGDFLHAPIGRLIQYQNAARRMLQFLRSI